jgi:hypothetical protein
VAIPFIYLETFPDIYDYFLLDFIIFCKQYLYARGQNNIHVWIVIKVEEIINVKGWCTELCSWQYSIDISLILIKLYNTYGHPLRRGEDSDKGMTQPAG